jgi:SH3-like domain-containing protein
MLIAAALSTGCLAQEALADEQLDPSPKPAGAPDTVPLSQTQKKSKGSKKGSASKVSNAPMAPAVAPAKGDMAVPRQNNVTVRGRTSINSEMVARLKKDDKVKVLDEITLKNPKGDEPAKWLKVSLPVSAAVWVNTAFIDANSKAVVPKQLNMRSGPSENYPVIGRVPKGTVVKTIDTKGEWTKIEAPDAAYGCVAAHLLTKEPASTSPTTTTTVPPTIAANDNSKPPFVPPVNPPQPIQVEPVRPPEVAVVNPAPITPTPLPPPVAPAPVVPPPVTPTTPPVVAPEALTRPEEPAEDPNAKRIVTREGIVRRSVSIQAPSFFVLENLNGKPIDYLHSSSTNVSLKNFFGKHIIVTGEELLDERWPNTPVISVDTLEQLEEPSSPAAPTDGNK